MITISGWDQMVDWLKQNRRDARLVTIDGFARAGKTTLGNRLGYTDDLGFSAVDLDKHLDKQQNQFVGALRLDELEAAIDSAPGRIALSGICMLAVLEKMRRKADLSIYVQRLDQQGYWRDGDNIDTDFLEQFAEALGGEASRDDALNLEDRDYHRAYRPHEVADVIFHPDY